MASAPENPDKSAGGNDRSLQWLILGGNNQHRIGANSGLCIYEETDSMGEKRVKRLLFDAGALLGDRRSPEYPELADCDNIIPDYARFLRKRGDTTPPPEPMDAIFLTHNHVDHSGALPFLLLMGYELPRIYATPYTAKRLEQEFNNANIPVEDWPEIISIAPGTPVREGGVSVSAFWVSHSTPQSVGFFIETPEGNILNPGDFKMDDSVVWGPAFSRAQFDRVVNKPVDLLLLDSTGADRDVELVTEHDVRESLAEIMEKHPGKRLIIAVMSGFEENVASIAKVSAEHSRTMWVSGWSHEQSLSALKETGMTLSDALGEHVDVRMLNAGKSARECADMKPGKSVVIVTGAVGTPGSSLPRAAEGKNPALTLDPKTDIILLNAPSIPGQEGPRERMISSLREQGFKVLTKREVTLYSHAHARQPDLIEMAKMAKAKTVLPIHGDTHLRAANLAAMEKAGFTAITADNGDAIHVTKTGCSSAAPETKGKPRFVGFKTLQGQKWTERNYLMIEAPQDKKASVFNEAANANGKPDKRPKIFRVAPK
jgi:ribonuclease J